MDVESGCRTRRQNRRYHFAVRENSPRQVSGWNEEGREGDGSEAQNAPKTEWHEGEQKPLMSRRSHKRCPQGSFPSCHATSGRLGNGALFFMHRANCPYQWNVCLVRSEAYPNHGRASAAPQTRML